MNIRNVLEQTALNYSQKTAIIFKDQKITFDELRTQTLKLANALKDLGVKKGDKVGIYLPAKRNHESIFRIAEIIIGFQGIRCPGFQVVDLITNPVETE